MAIFPTSAVAYGPTGLQNTNNLGNTTLVVDIDGAQDSFSVSDATNLTTWPTEKFVVLVEEELMFVTSRSTNLLTGVTRGFGGTANSAHITGTRIITVLASTSIQAAYQEIVALEKALLGQIPANLSIDGSLSLIGTGNLDLNGNDLVDCDNATLGSLTVTGAFTAGTLNGTTANISGTATVGTLAATLANISSTMTAGTVNGTSGTITTLAATTGNITTVNATTTNTTNINAATVDSSATQLGFYGVSQVNRPSAYTQTYVTADKTHANPTQAAVATTGSTQVTPFGYTTSAQADAIVTALNAAQNDMLDLKQLVNSLIDDLQALGLVQ